jgi:hypothetical protein
VSLPRSKSRADFLTEMAQREAGMRVYAPEVVERRRVADGRCLRCGAELPMWRKLRRYVLCGRCDV